MSTPTPDVLTPERVRECRAYAELNEADDGPWSDKDAAILDICDSHEALRSQLAALTARIEQLPIHPTLMQVMDSERGLIGEPVQVDFLRRADVLAALRETVTTATDTPDSGSTA